MYLINILTMMTKEMNNMGIRVPKVDIYDINEWVWEYSSIMNIDKDISYRLNDIDESGISLIIVETSFGEPKISDEYMINIAFNNKKLISVDEWVLQNKKEELGSNIATELEKISDELYNSECEIEQLENKLRYKKTDMESLKKRKLELREEYKRIVGHEWSGLSDEEDDDEN